ncbi:hypothetical protein DO021_07245 [Desulfobacter hydrogenophilus]|uniref:Uncharacterized protein n=1 Tax=Desulfobacter hydrogenophilus TaxID=2291 RepID=A0A328FEA2_9BACT|nr:hypothetical protein DO021_07245 [Desulfobacter hydrogenophilus]
MIYQRLIFRAKDRIRRIIIINMETMYKMFLNDMEPAENLSTWYFCPHCQKRLFKGNIKTLRMTCPNCNRLIESDGKSSLSLKKRGSKLVPGEQQI